MRTLAIDTSGAALSIGLFDGARLIGHVHERIGRGHAEALVPAIAGLPDGGRAGRILIGRGPGSFTGVRVGLAAARALAFAWNADICGFSSHDLVIAALPDIDPSRLLIVTDAGHGQWFVTRAGVVPAITRPLDPAEAVRLDQAVVAGDRADAFMALRGGNGGVAFNRDPDARHALALAAGSLVADTTPIYGRAPDAVAAPSLQPRRDRPASLPG